MKKMIFSVVVFTTLLIHGPCIAGWVFPGSDEAIAEKAKATMVLVVGETKSIYSNSKTESDFLDAVLFQIPKEKRSDEVINYFKQVFYYHSRGFSESKIREHEDGKTLIALANLGAKSGSAENSFFLDGDNPQSEALKGWKKWLELLLQILPLIIALL